MGLEGAKVGKENFVEFFADCSDEKFDQLKLNDLIAQLRTRFPEVTPKIDGVSRLLLDADAANQSMNKLYVILRDICNRKWF